MLFLDEPSEPIDHATAMRPSKPLARPAISIAGWPFKIAGQRVQPVGTGTATNGDQQQPNQSQHRTLPALLAATWPERTRLVLDLFKSARRAERAGFAWRIRDRRWLAMPFHRCIVGASKIIENRVTRTRGSRNDACQRRARRRPPTSRSSMITGHFGSLPMGVIVPRS